MLASYLEEEIHALGERFDTPFRVDVTLDGAPFRPITATDRIGEVCMVLRRRNGKLLAAKTTYYPPGVFRLLTGGVAPGESILAALLREVQEETGLEVAVRRFLAVIEYRFRAADAPDDPPAFATLAFLVEEIGGTFGTLDESEQIESFREVDADDLPALADTLDHLTTATHPEVEGSWADWGRFRAVVHRVVYEALGTAADDGV